MLLLGGIVLCDFFNAFFWFRRGRRCLLGRPVVAPSQFFQRPVDDQTRSLAELVVLRCHHAGAGLHGRQGVDGDHGELLTRRDGVLAVLVIAGLGLAEGIKTIIIVTTTTATTQIRPVVLLLPALRLWPRQRYFGPWWLRSVTLLRPPGDWRRLVGQGRQPDVLLHLVGAPLVSGVWDPVVRRRSRCIEPSGNRVRRASRIQTRWGVVVQSRGLFPRATAFPRLAPRRAVLLRRRHCFSLRASPRLGVRVRVRRDDPPRPGARVRRDVEADVRSEHVLLRRDERVRPAFQVPGRRARSPAPGRDRGARFPRPAPPPRRRAVASGGALLVVGQAAQRHCGCDGPLLHGRHPTVRGGRLEETTGAAAGRLVAGFDRDTETLRRELVSNVQLEGALPRRGGERVQALGGLGFRLDVRVRQHGRAEGRVDERIRRRPEIQHDGALLFHRHRCGRGVAGAIDMDAAQGAVRPARSRSLSRVAIESMASASASVEWRICGFADSRIRGLDWTGLDWIGLNWTGGPCRCSVRRGNPDSPRLFTCFLFEESGFGRPANERFCQAPRAGKNISPCRVQCGAEPLTAGLSISTDEVTTSYHGLLVVFSVVTGSSSPSYE